MKRSLYGFIVFSIAATLIVASRQYSKRVDESKIIAREMFDKALKLEMQKRSDIPISLFSSHPNGTLASKKELGETIITSKYGRKKYRLSPVRNEYNIEQSSKTTRFQQSLVLESSPLRANSFHCVWDSLLRQQQVFVRPLVRVSILDLLENETRQYSVDSVLFSMTDSLCSYYIGLRGEVEVTGFVSYPFFQILTSLDWFLLTTLFLVLALGGIIVRLILRFYHTHLVKERIIERKVVIEKEVFVPVIALEEKGRCVYQMESDLLFDADNRCLMRNGCVVAKLTEQPAMLLRAFLEAKEYKLTISEIAVLLWSDKQEPLARIYTLIGRLRNTLKRVSDWEIQSGDASYKLNRSDTKCKI